MQEAEDQLSQSQLIFVLVSWQEFLVNETTVTAFRYDWRALKEEVGSCIKAVLQECHSEF